MVRKHQFENLNGFVFDLSFSVGSYQFFICHHIYLLLLQEIGNPTCIGSTYRCSICGLPILSYDIGSIQSMLNQPAGSRIDISRLYQVPSTRTGRSTLMDRKR